MKKSLLFSLMLISIVSVQAAKKVAYITDPAQATYANDTKILPMLKADTNFVVTEIVATTAGQDLSGYDLVVVAEPAGSAASMVVAAESLNKPMLNMKVFAYKTTVWNWVTANTAIVDNTTADSVLIQKPEHLIFAGMGFTKGSKMLMLSGHTSGTKGLNGVTAYNNVVGAIDTLATINAATGSLCMMEIPVGTSVNGTTIQQKFIQVGISGTSYALVSEDALKVISNAVYYLAGLTKTSEVSAPEVVKLYNVTRNENGISIATTEQLNLSLFSVSGQQISKTVGNSIATSNLRNGVYLLQINGKNGTQTVKFIK